MYRLISRVRHRWNHRISDDIKCSLQDKVDKGDLKYRHIMLKIDDKKMEFDRYQSHFASLK
jgi:hypothetical protein